jgi:hypothetical protein
MSCTRSPTGEAISMIASETSWLAASWIAGVSIAD